MNGQMMVFSYVSYIYPGISASHRSFDGCFLLGAGMSLPLISGQFLPWSYAKISHSTSLYTLILSIGWLSGWKQDHGQW